MRINFDRICKLAGVQPGKKSLNEGSRLNWHDDPNLRPEADVQYAKGKDPQLFEGEHEKKEGMSDIDEMDELGYYEEGAHEKEEGYHKEGAHEKEEGHGRMMMMKERDIESEFFSEEERLDEMVEVDIAELMSEIRRAKKIMSLRESRKNDRLRKQKLQESHLKKIIQKEVENILQEMSEHSRFEKKQAVRKSLRLRNTIPGLGFKK